MRRLVSLTIIVIAVVLAGAASAQQDAADTSMAALGTAFTYQGRLQEGGSPASGSYDLQCALFDAAAGGSQIGSTVAVAGVSVSDGLFAVTLDFGAGAFGSAARWLEIRVRPGGSGGAYTPLAPRQQLTPAPSALYAAAAPPTGAAGGALTGSYPSPSIAAGAVTKAMLSASGGSGGQVLSTDGTNLLWQTVSAGIGGSGSAGQVAYWSGASSLSGSSKLFWDSANSRLGIGTASPNQQLELTGMMRMPVTAATSGTPTAGVLFVGDSRFLHNYGTVYAGNTFVGEEAGNFTMGGTGVEGQMNTGVGQSSLTYNTTGSHNAAFGRHSLINNTKGKSNTAVGSLSMYQNRTASNNVAVGFAALEAQAFDNGGVEWASSNTAVGSRALNSNNPTSTDNGGQSTAVGAESLSNNTTGAANTAIGFGSLSANQTGSQNTVVGMLAGGNAGSVSGNVLLGYWAGYNETASNRLHIANSDTSTLIYGRFDTSRVGIATTTTPDTLTVGGGVRVDSLGVNAGDLSTAALKFGASTTGEGIACRRTAGGNQYGLDFFTNSVARVSITATGLVGVGTASPASTLSVVGGVHVDQGNTNGGDLTSAALKFGLAGTGEGIVSKRSSGGIQNGLELFTNYLARLSITNAGNVGIGTSSPSQALDVNGQMRVRQITGSSSTPICQAGDGTLVNCVAPSDARLKREVVPLVDGTDVVAALPQLRGVRYRWEPEAVARYSLADRPEIGMIAQEVEGVLPELVREGVDGTRSLDYARLTAFLVEVAKAQQVEIAALRARLEALEGAMTGRLARR